MQTYKHNLLFDRQDSAVQKTYRIPRRLEGYITALAARHKLTNTDVVIEALLHYFSTHVVLDLTEEIEGVAARLCLEGKEDADKRNRGLLKERRRLELIRLEFCEHFGDSLEKILLKLRNFEKNNLTNSSPQVLDQKDLEIATLKLLLEKSNRQLKSAE